MAEQSRKPKPDPAETEMPFQEMIIERTKQWARDYDEANRPRLADGVTMTELPPQ